MNYAPNEQFVRSLTEYQSRLYTYILAMLGDPNAADDVFQNTNVAIWRKAEGYAEGTHFWAWISRIAHFEVMAYRKRRQRDRLVFDDALLADIAEEAARQTDLVNADLAALHRCMEKLTSLDRKLVQTRYSPGGSVKRLAEMLGKTAGAISQALYRVRGELADCVEREKGTTP